MPFFARYINFVAYLGTKIENPEWWLTSLASKNRFQSPLLSYFEQFELKKSTILPPPQITVLGFFKSSSALVLKCLYAWFVGLRLRRKILHSAKKFKIFATFAYEANFKENKFNDAYWGKLPEKMSQNNLVLELHNPISCFKQSINFAVKNEKIIPLHIFVSPLDLVRVFARSLKLFVGWDIKKFEKYVGVKSDVHGMLISEVFNPSFTFALLVEEVYRKLTRMDVIEKVYMPYEGNGWERGLVLGVKSINPKIEVWGYVHTVIPEISCNLFPGDGEYLSGPFPDKILTLGEIPYKILNSMGAYPEGKLVSSCALRFESLFKLQKLNYNPKKQLLILLEGVFPAVTVVDYFLTEATKNPDWNFQFRFHPALTWEKMRSLSKFKGEIGENIIFSKGKSLFQEIEESGIVAYWGSTAGIEALYMGRPVIHLDLGSALSYDPLFMHEGFHWKVNTSDELSVTLRKIDSLSEDKKNELCSLSQNYLESYFGKITEEKLQLFF